MKNKATVTVFLVITLLLAANTILCLARKDARVTELELTLERSQHQVDVLHELLKRKSGN